MICKDFHGAFLENVCSSWCGKLVDEVLVRILFARSALFSWVALERQLKESLRHSARKPFWLAVTQLEMMKRFVCATYCAITLVNS